MKVSVQKFVVTDLKPGQTKTGKAFVRGSGRELVFSKKKNQEVPLPFVKFVIWDNPQAQSLQPGMVLNITEADGDINIYQGKSSFELSLRQFQVIDNAPQYVQNNRQAAPQQYQQQQYQPAPQGQMPGFGAPAGYEQQQQQYQQPAPQYQQQAPAPQPAAQPAVNNLAQAPTYGGYGQ